jgi:hypothetical protein
LLSYFPQLRRLPLGRLDGRGNNRKYRTPITLNYLTNVSLKLHFIDYTDFEELVSDVFRHVQILRIGILAGFSDDRMEYLDADRWEHLISTHMPNLSIFDFQHRYQGWVNDSNGQKYKSQVNTFNSSFWIERQWFFEHQYYRTALFKTTIFYSKNTHR